MLNENISTRVFKINLFSKNNNDRPKLQPSGDSRGSVKSKSHDVQEIDDYIHQKEEKRAQSAKNRSKGKSMSPRTIYAEISEGVSKIFGEKSTSSDQA